MSQNEDWTKKPPEWCKDAIATEFGWTDKETGEVYISMKGLLDTALKSKRKPVTIEKKKEIREKNKNVKTVRKEYLYDKDGVGKNVEKESKEWYNLLKNGYMTLKDYKKMDRGKK